MKRFLFLFISIFLFSFADDSLNLKYDNKDSKYDAAMYDGEGKENNQNQTGGTISPNQDPEIGFLRPGLPQSLTCSDDEGDDCDNVFNNAVNSWKDTTEELLNNLSQEWENSNTELQKNINYARELVRTQERELALQQEKVLRLQEISFNLQKAVDLNVPNIEILQTKQKLNKNILTK